MVDEGMNRTCRACIHGKPNTGLIIPVQEREYFCLKVSKVEDVVAQEILEALLERAQAGGECPVFDAGNPGADSYLAADLPNV